MSRAQLPFVIAAVALATAYISFACCVPHRHPRFRNISQPITAFISFLIEPPPPLSASFRPSRQPFWSRNPSHQLSPNPSNPGIYGLYMKWVDNILFVVMRLIETLVVSLGYRCDSFNGIRIIKTRRFANRYKLEPGTGCVYQKLDPVAISSNFINSNFRLLYASLIKTTIELWKKRRGIF